MTFQANTADFKATSETNAGLAKGTIVLTLRGEVAVEDLQVGDKVITRDVGAQPLRGLNCHSGDSSIVAKHSFGTNRPMRDMRVSVAQPFLMRHDGPVFATARLMAQDSHSRLENTPLYCLVFDQSHVIYADGAELAVA